MEAQTHTNSEWKNHPAVAELVDRLSAALGDRLRAVVLHGPAARGDGVPAAHDLHLLLLLTDLSLETLAAAGPALSKWAGRGLPVPRLFSPDTLANAADVFPIELADIAERHLVVHGSEPLASMPPIDPHCLRLQCERELREKMMRLQEGYTLSRGRETEIRRLLVSSFPAFAMIFRGCLRLHGDSVPDSAAAAAEAFCRLAGIDPAPLAEADKIRRGRRDGVSLADVFRRYYDVLDQAVQKIDRFFPPTGTTRSES